MKSPFEFRGVSIRGKALDKRAHGIGLTLTNLVKGTLSDPSKIQRFLLADPAQHPNILLGWSGCSSPGQAECRVRIEKVGRRSTFLRSPRRLALFPRNDRSEGGNRPSRGYPTAPSGIRTSRIESPAGDQDSDLSFAEFSKEFSLGILVSLMGERSVTNQLKPSGYCAFKHGDRSRESSSLSLVPEQSYGGDGCR